MYDKNVSSSEKQANNSESQANKIIHKFPCYALAKWSVAHGTAIRLYVGIFSHG